MYILAFETSCDDTSVALMKDNVLVSMSTRTQLEHEVTGGVVPEVAARSHANAIFPCIDDVLFKGNINISDIDHIACTDKPGLLPSLLTGMTVAKTLSLTLKKPIIFLDHITSHIFANFLERSLSDVVFPAVVLTVSGGHTEIYLWKSLFEFEMLGQTLDDAAGECFDKVAKMMGLGFPGGAKIAGLAQKFRDSYHSDSELPENLFPLVLLDKDSLDFSFSGLKTAIKREIDKRLEVNASSDDLQNSHELSDEDKQEISFHVEEVISDILMIKSMRALEKYGASMLLLAGGVSANTVLKNKLAESMNNLGVPFLSPVKNLYSMDNAGMVGIHAFYRIKYGLL